MKKLLPFLVFFLFFGGMLTFTTNVINRNNCKAYSLDLQEQGYSKAWADHKANVEYGFVEADEEYWSIQED